MKLLIYICFGILVISGSKNSNKNEEESQAVATKQKGEEFSDDLSIEERNRIISQRDKQAEQQVEKGKDRQQNKAKLLRKLKRQEIGKDLSRKKTSFKDKKKGISYAVFSKTEKASVKSALKECSGAKNKSISVIINKQGKAFIPPDSKLKPDLKKCLQSKLSGLSFFEGQPRKTVISIN